MESNAQAPITVNVFVENVIATQNGTAQVFRLEDKYERPNKHKTFIEHKYNICIMDSFEF